MIVTFILFFDSYHVVVAVAYGVSNLNFLSLRSEFFEHPFHYVVVEAVEAAADAENEHRFLNKEFFIDANAQIYHTQR